MLEVLIFISSPISILVLFLCSLDLSVYFTIPGTQLNNGLLCCLSLPAVRFSILWKRRKVDAGIESTDGFSIESLLQQTWLTTLWITARERWTREDDNKEKEASGMGLIFILYSSILKWFWIWYLYINSHAIIWTLAMYCCRSFFLL